MSEPIEVLLKRLTAIARGRQTAKGFHFFCQIGSEGWKGGLTTLQIAGTGWVLLSHRPRLTEREEGDLYSCYISTRDLRAFVKKLLQHPFWELDNSRQYQEEDETNVHFRLMDTGNRFSWERQIWSNERHKQRNLNELLDILRAIIEGVSDGEVRIEL